MNVRKCMLPFEVLPEMTIYSTQGKGYPALRVTCRKNMKLGRRAGSGGSGEEEGDLQYLLKTFLGPVKKFTKVKMKNFE